MQNHLSGQFEKKSSRRSRGSNNSNSRNATPDPVINTEKIDDYDASNLKPFAKHKERRNNSNNLSDFKPGRQSNMRSVTPTHFGGESNYGVDSSVNLSHAGNKIIMQPKPGDNTSKNTNWLCCDNRPSRA